MRVVLKGLGILFILLVIVAVIPALVPDEEYTADVKQWLKDANTHADLPDEVNRFNALVGFRVDADKDMVAEGAKLVAEVNEQFSDTAKKNNEIAKFNDYWDHPPLTISGDLFDVTSAFKEDPAQWLLDNNDLYHELISSNLVLIERFRKLMTMKQYSHTMNLNMNAPMLSYSDFLSAKRLNNLSIINEFIIADKQNAIHSLQQSIIFSKLMMEQSVSLLDKMIANASLQIDLFTYSSLLDHSPADSVPELHIVNLNKDERSMLNVAMGEFAMLSTALDFDDSYRFNHDSAESDVLESLFLKLYFKRKAMENNAYKNTWLPLIEMQGIPLVSRASKALEYSEENELTWWQIYLDPFGYIFSAIAAPDYIGYAGKIDHVDAAITLLNLKASIYSNNITFDNIENYISSSNAVMITGYTGAKFSWDKDKRELSFDIPGYKDEVIPRVTIKEGIAL